MPERNIDTVDVRQNRRMQEVHARYASTGRWRRRVQMELRREQSIPGIQLDILGDDLVSVVQVSLVHPVAAIYF